MGLPSRETLEYRLSNIHIRLSGLNMLFKAVLVLLIFLGLLASQNGHPAQNCLRILFSEAMHGCVHKGVIFRMQPLN
jgi:hypothetical protein